MLQQLEVNTLRITNGDDSFVFDIEKPENTNNREDKVIHWTIFVLADLDPKRNVFILNNVGTGSSLNEAIENLIINNFISYSHVLVYTPKSQEESDIVLDFVKALPMN